MIHTNFFDKKELQILRKSVLENYDPTRYKNEINLSNIEEITAKLISFFTSEVGISVQYLRSGIFLASTTTMSWRDTMPTQGWHTDGTCRIIDGDCFNVWIPIYNDSDNTGLEIITEKDNAELYTTLGDATYPVEVYTRYTSKHIFEILHDHIPAESDLILLKIDLGKIIPLSSPKIKVITYKNPRPGDLVIFKQSELHRGFHHGGIRIQLSLKFKSSNAKLNSKSSNSLYPIFRECNKEPYEYNEFSKFEDRFNVGNALSKHGLLEKDLITTLLKNEYFRINSGC